MTTHLTLKELLISDQLFLILYKELYYRHVYARVQVSERKKKTLTFNFKCMDRKKIFEHLEVPCFANVLTIVTIFP